MSNTKKKTKKTGLQKKYCKVGRPFLWENPKEMAIQINEYFKNTPFEEYTITGLTLALNTSRRVLCEYQAKEKFQELITKAKLIVEHSYEVSLRKKGKAGDIFALKNFGWKDDQVLIQNINASKTENLNLKELNKEDIRQFINKSLNDD